MKTNNSNTVVNSSLFCVTILITVIGLLFSCKKQDVPVASSTITRSAQILKGEGFCGTLQTESDQHMIILNLNKGSKIILLEKLQPIQSILPKSLESSEIIISSYGMLIHERNNKTWLLVNNDPESISKFREVKALLGTDCQTIMVFGSTVIKPAKS